MERSRAASLGERHHRMGRGSGVFRGESALLSGSVRMSSLEEGGPFQLLFECHDSFFANMFVCCSCRVARQWCVLAALVPGSLTRPSSL
jgi:hypothetical protein